MSLDSEALKLAIKIGEDVKNLKETLGDTSELKTKSKTLDGAINELKLELSALKSSGIINDQAS